MIKLNNKNITYVALADSANSLKAPKEIWYADSNNSVKLVYRRKDALIEGEDYEKYHWLKGDGTAYIDTGIIVPTEKFVCITRLRNRETRTVPNSFLAFTVRQEQSAVLPFVSVNPRTDEQRYYVDLTNPRSYVPFGSGMFDINITMPSASTLQGDLMFFRSKNLNFGNSPWIGDIATFSLTSLDSTFRVEMLPCKLLKPVPKWLDANGIRRQVGECGMIDLVSGKFYGNINSVGTFTVENYYERKGWLKVSVSAKVDMIGLPVDSPNLYFKHKHISGINYHYFRTTGEGVDYDYFYEADAYRCSIWNLSNKTAVYRTSDITEDEIVINCNSSNRYVNGYDIPIYGSTIKQVSIISRNQNGFEGLISSITIDNIERYIPCTLTMDLPASMDANNIARTKGTSGMWDLVSDRFYGNVASSGTFKAVNLAEGVDYEVHQWLKTEVNTKATLMTLDINSYSFSFSRKPLSGSNVPYFITEGSDVYLYSNSDNTIRIWNASQYGYYYSHTPFNWGDTISITSSSNSLVVNSQTIPQNTFPVQVIYFGANDANRTENYTSSITVDGIERYIPVKLLRSIPAKYDANGIARQAGECGMYDTVNDVFYGNVASSGTFSVSD